MEKYNEFGEKITTIRWQGILVYCTGVLQLLANEYILRIASLVDMTLPYIGILIISLFVFVGGVLNIYCGCLWAIVPRWKPQLRWRLIRRKM
ncbi:hypothetical protein KC902_03445 [Candidatus Kaiserbacteria bacterium]|nr:hypothetical protein [Candidatus Kaiserbacteria bacterium]USN88545.1 MAG: hypothetical protein H6780_03600 [Candidatus Nomurabacteria bacterium]